MTRYDREYSGEIKYVKQIHVENYTRHELYTTWRMMNVRCLDDRHKAYHRYGGRGITVCEQWRWDNELGLFNFIRDVGIRPEDTTLDKINNDLGYSPDNVRWASKRLQQNNIGKGFNNTSGHIGVRKEGNNYVVIIMLNKRSVTIGTFNLNELKEASNLYEEVRTYKLTHTDDETLEYVKSLNDYSPTNKRLRINKTSKYYGVSWDSSRCKWRAMCSYRETENGKVINKMVGRFDCEEDAYEAVLKFLDWVKENGYYKKMANKEFM
jgi:hypothetical protein